MIVRRSFPRLWNAADALPHLVNQSAWSRGLLQAASGGGVHLQPCPLMETSPGRFIPAAQDPTDPRTWRVPVVFT